MCQRQEQTLDRKPTNLVERMQVVGQSQMKLEENSDAVVLETMAELHD